VKPDAKRIRAVEKLVAEVAKTGCQLVLAPNTEVAAAHAAAEQLITVEGLKKVRLDRDRDARA
jgi:hypothetical protein